MLKYVDIFLLVSSYINLYNLPTYSISTCIKRPVNILPATLDYGYKPCDIGLIIYPITHLPAMNDARSTIYVEIILNYKNALGDMVRGVCYDFTTGLSQ